MDFRKLKGSMEALYEGTSVWLQLTVSHLQQPT
jgi:hypothetical protein